MKGKTSGPSCLGVIRIVRMTLDCLSTQDLLFHNGKAKVAACTGSAISFPPDVAVALEGTACTSSAIHTSSATPSKKQEGERSENVLNETNRRD